MKLRVVLAAFFVVGMSALCVRLGFWQLSRLHEKQALNAALRSALAQPPMIVEAPLPAASVVQGRRIQVEGEYDERHQILLAGRANQGSPGVHVVTPLLIANDRAVLVDRGWLYSDDAATAHPERVPEPGPRSVVGIAEALIGGRGGSALAMIRSDSATLVSARWLDRDSLATRFPYRLAEFSVRQLPARGVPAQPLRTNPTPHDEMMHLSYAIQWFSFATILVVGSLILTLRRKRPTEVVPPFGEHAT